MKIVLLLVLLIFSNAEANSFLVMSYNVENLFDAKHDIVSGKDKKDWTFLPREAAGKSEACRAEKNRHRKKECLETDWSDAKVEMKLSQIADAVTRERALPEFLGLVEVENGEIVGRLAKKLGYDHFDISESPDERGVDVALLFKEDKKLKKISRKEHIVPVEYATRNILEVEFLVDDRFPLTIFVNHWPSLANPDSWRVKAAEVLAERTKEILKKNPKMSILAMGDFNTIDSNDPHPFKTVLFKEGLFTDTEEFFLKNKMVDEKLKQEKAPGTYYFPPKDQWNSLDHFFINNELFDGKDLDIDISSFQIYSPRFLTYELKKKTYIGEEKNIKVVLKPNRFNPMANTKEEMGYSDHFPILIKLSYPDKLVNQSSVKNTKVKKIRK